MTREDSLDRSMKGEAKQLEAGYEGGWEMAPCRGDTPGLSATAVGASLAAEWHRVQSVHEAAPKRAAVNLEGVQDAAESSCVAEAVSALEAMVATFEPEPRKNDACESLAGRRLSECGTVLLKQLLEVLPLRSKTTGEGVCSGVFPLPTSRSAFLGIEPVLGEEVLTWTECVVLSLNSLWGVDLTNERMANKVQQTCLKGIFQEVRRFCALEHPVEELQWKDFFSIRSIDYKGEEVKVARKFCWKNICPALPKEIGRVPLADLCTHGSKHYVMNFDHYLRPRTEWKLPKPPRVMVEEKNWGEVCEGLVATGVCTFIEEAEIFHTERGPLLNGLFGVSKEEWTDQGTEVFRLIMNLVPLNSLCRAMSGDVDTLPSWGTMSPYFLQPTQCLLVSSEDVKCFFYTLSVPPCWVKYLAFNKLVPHHVLPQHLQGKRVYLASQVLPMGFLNSVSLAQHVHRNLVLARSQGTEAPANAPERELRKDRSFVAGDTAWRIYLDNYDLLEKVEATTMVEVEGTLAPGALALRQQYEQWNVPRNVKKTVQRSSRCEVQGATVDGTRGVAYPREGKLAKYFALAMRLCRETSATQKQWQVVCGGLVYFAMFRRPLLGGLNQVWQHIERFERESSHVRKTPRDCILEVLRFLGCLPLARLDFRLDMHPVVTCSDASQQGGGICASHSLTSYGALVAQGSLRGEVAEHTGDHMVLSVGLFDGIGALRVALDVLEAQVIGHVSVEQDPKATRVVEAHFPGTMVVPAVEAISEEMVLQWSTRFSQCSVIILGAGPPCQGVSGLNADRQGALKDARSSLFAHVPRVRGLLKKYFAWCPVFTLMESVASMDKADRKVMSEAIGAEPLLCNAGTFTWCNRPRLYWIDWEVSEGHDVPLETNNTEQPRTIVLEGCQDIKQVIREGWLKVDPQQAFPTFTTSRPQKKAGRKPAGIHHCTMAELERWSSDLHRFPPTNTEINTVWSTAAMF